MKVNLKQQMSNIKDIFELNSISNKDLQFAFMLDKII